MCVCVCVYIYIPCGDSLVAQLVKDFPSMKEFDS